LNKNVDWLMSVLQGRRGISIYPLPKLIVIRMRKYRDFYLKEWDIKKK
jgi:hypothetical protein